MPENPVGLQESKRIAERRYWENVGDAARRLAESARIHAVDPATSGGRRVYADISALKAALSEDR